MMPFKPGESGNPLGTNVHKGKSPRAEYQDEPDAPQMLRDMRWVYCKGVLPAGATAGQKAVKMLLEADGPRFLATLERLEGEWSEEKKRRAREGLAADSSPLPGSSDAPLDDTSAKVVDAIDRWLATHRKQAELLHPPSQSDRTATTGLAKGR